MLPCAVAKINFADIAGSDPGSGTSLCRIANLARLHFFWVRL